MIKDALIRNLKDRFKAYDDIVEGIDDVKLNEKLDVPRHKSLADHLWCVVGARESYAKAIRAGEWNGFNCSLKDHSPADFTRKLRDSAAEVISAVESVTEWTDMREELLLALAEHEVMHEGQIIRHLYGLGREIPRSVKWA